MTGVDKPVVHPETAMVLWDSFWFWLGDAQGYAEAAYASRFHLLQEVAEIASMLDVCHAANGSPFDLETFAVEVVDPMGRWLCERARGARWQMPETALVEAECVERINATRARWDI